MSLTEEHLRIASRIDSRVRVLERTGANEVDILTNLIDEMPSFKHLLDTAKHGGMNALCERLDGFYRYAKIIEVVAAGISTGEIAVPPPSQPPNAPRPPARPLPPLTINKRFMDAFISADPPCFALGLVEEDERACGFFALRPSIPVPPEIFSPGFQFGHSVISADYFEVLHFAFAFYGFHTYNALVNPNNPTVQTVLDVMLARGDYFFFVIDAYDGRATAFRSEIGQMNLFDIENNLARIRRSTTNDGQYRQAVAQFERNPNPPGTLLTWVCQDDVAHLDFTKDRLTFTPSA